MNYYLIPNYENLSYDERYNKATHYHNHGGQPHHSLLGYVDESGTFVSVLITLHRARAKENFKEYDAFKMKKK